MNESERAIILIFLIIITSGSCLSGLFESFYGDYSIFPAVSAFSFAVNILVMMGFFIVLINITNNWWKVSLVSSIYYLTVVLFPLISIIFNPWKLWVHLMCMLIIQSILFIPILFFSLNDKCNKFVLNIIN